MVATKPKPTGIKLHKISKSFEISFDDEKTFVLPCEYLRVYSPSAEVQGHGPGQDVLQTGKENVNIEAIEPMGHYAVKLCFSDGHNTGIYSWNVLYGLGVNYEQKWASYLKRLEEAGYKRKAVEN